MPVAVVDGIFIARKASAPMQRLGTAKVIAGVGIENDRYSGKAGTYSVLRDSAQQHMEGEPGRQITLVSADAVEESLREAGVEPLKTVGDLRRNVVLRGMSAATLLDAIGARRCHVAQLPAPR